MPTAPLEPQVFRKNVLEVLIIKNFVVLQKVLQNLQHYSEESYYLLNLSYIILCRNLEYEWKSTFAIYY